MAEEGGLSLFGAKAMKLCHGFFFVCVCEELYLTRGSIDQSVLASSSCLRPHSRAPSESFSFFFYFLSKARNLIIFI